MAAQETLSIRLKLTLLGSTLSSTEYETDKHNQIKLWTHEETTIVMHVTEFEDELGGNTWLSFYAINPATNTVQRRIDQYEMIPDFRTHLFFSDSVLQSESADYLCHESLFRFEFNYPEGHFRCYFLPNGCSTKAKYEFAEYIFKDGRIILIGMYSEKSWEQSGF